MSVKIILSRTKEPAEKRELVFGEESISIGREPSNVLPLTGTQISKLHARIERQGSDYYIVDLNSTNSTYLNGEKLIAGKQLPLRQGDKVSISDYDLQFFPIDALSTPGAIPPADTARPPKTVVDLPRKEGQPATAKTPSSEYEERWSKLTTEIEKTLEAFNILDLARRHEELQARCNVLAEENRKLKAESLNPPNTGEHRSTPVQEAQPADEARLEQVMRVLLPLFYKLASGRSSFLSEFIVRTVVRTTNGLPAQSSQDEEAIRYFTDSQLSDKEFAERLALLKKEADQIVLHMMGLLEGYRRSVDEGGRRILQRVDPDRLGEDLADSALGSGTFKIPLRYFPFLLDLRIYRLVRNRLRDLLQEDRGVLEKQVFRPGFVRAYEECVEPATYVLGSSRMESMKP